MAIKTNIIVDQGTDFITSINVADTDGESVPLSGYTGAAQFRKHYNSSTSYAFDVNVYANGEVSMGLSANVTSLIPAGRYVYDCELTSPQGVKSRLVEGIVTITPQVTR